MVIARGECHSLTRLRIIVQADARRCDRGCQATLLLTNRVEKMLIDPEKMAVLPSENRSCWHGIIGEESFQQ
jgi:hypothetical protein